TLVTDEQDLPAVPAEDGDRERAPVGHAGAHLSVKAATPGSTLPSRNSSEAPPPVDTCETLLATPAFFTAEAEAPPPTMVVAPASASRLRASSSLSFSTIDLPTSSPCALRKV